jgi:hypothetical protein
LERGELESKEKTVAELGQFLHGARRSSAGGADGFGGNGTSEMEQQLANVDQRFRRIGSTARANSDNLRDAVGAYEVPILHH